jgi:hypothetical protein
VHVCDNAEHAMAALDRAEYGRVSLKEVMCEL